MYTGAENDAFKPNQPCVRNGISHIDIFARSGDMELYDEEPLSVEDVHYYQEQMNDLLFREWKVSIDAWIKEKRSTGMKL